MLSSPKLWFGLEFDKRSLDTRDNCWLGFFYTYWAVTARYRFFSYKEIYPFTKTAKLSGRLLGFNPVTTFVTEKFQGENEPNLYLRPLILQQILFSDTPPSTDTLSKSE